MESVACQSIPRHDGNGADGCGAGWVQEAGVTKTCPKCKRKLVVTGRYLLIPLRKVT